MKPVKPNDIEHRYNEILDLVNLQADDEGLWFEAKWSSEDYLQRALRKLHELIERDF